MKILIGFGLVLALTALALALLLALDRRADHTEWKRLAALQPTAPETFRLEMVANLPATARRYFAYTIEPGTPLLPVVDITMDGKFSLGTRHDPAYQRMSARQILAAPSGFVWAMRTRSGMPVSGSDSGQWTRFRVLWLIPVARFGGSQDHRRSAYGRYVAEAVIWSPAALLPGPGVEWSQVDDNTARVTMRQQGLEQSVDVLVDVQGRPTEVRFQRWSDANPQKTHRLQPFGGYLSDFRRVDGYRLPFRVEAGNMFGTDEYFPFFIAEVSQIGFPGASLR